MDSKAFFKLSYGLYVISSRLDGKDCGCVVNTLAQVTGSPAKMTVAVNKDNVTEQAIAQSRSFAAVVLTQETDSSVVGTFGFHTSKELNKFDGFAFSRDEQGNAYLTQQVAARYSCHVVEQIDLGSHVLFVGEVTEAEVLGSQEVMTYAYYHQVKKGLTPKNAPSYQAQQSTNGSYRCSVCGYMLESATLPADYICPICGATSDKFVKQS